MIWDNLSLSEKCAVLRSNALDEVLKMESTLNAYEKANPHQTKVIAEKREQIRVLCVALEYFGWLIADKEGDGAIYGDGNMETYIEKLRTTIEKLEK
jgi:hypothetical protein